VFGAVLLTPVVAAEIGIDASGATSKAGGNAIRQSLAAGWLTIVKLDAEVSYPPLNPGVDAGVDAGESSSIALALHQQACGERVLMIIDDRCGRAEARRQGLPIVGTAAVLVLAKERNLIPTCGPLLLAMREEGYFLSDALVAAVLNQAGES